MKTHYIVVTGGVISGVGKGVTTASLGKIVKEYGYKTTLIKIDPYINFDAGTLRPTEHGEVWVTNDGGEIDQDLGTYERFIDQDIPKINNITTGQIYKSVIDKERKGHYLGQTVQFVPHILDEIKERIVTATKDYEIAVIELGGTVGDYENVPYLYALKALEREIGPDFMTYVLVTYLPVPLHIHEMKTKPTQQAIRLLGQEGILPDFIICRAHQPLDQVRRKKIEVYANIPSDHIISAPDIDNIYQMPLDLEQEGIGKKILKHLDLKPRKKPDWTTWKQLVFNIRNPKKRIHVAIVGKYLNLGDYSLTDSYVSIDQALVHAGAHQKTGIDITWVNAVDFEENKLPLSYLKKFDGIIIPGGFGPTGVEGKIQAIHYARKNNIAYLGLCYGMHLAIVEFARNECGLQKAHTTEVDPQTPYPVIDILPSQKEVLEQEDYGGTMRLGAYSADLQKKGKVFELYQATQINNVEERHRHRYEVNPQFVSLLESKGLIFSGYHKRDDGTKLMEFIELENHPFFIATQAHPEFKSRLSNPAPLFYGFITACSLQKSENKQFIKPAIKEKQITR